MERISGEKKMERKKNLTDRVASEERVDLGSRGRRGGAARSMDLLGVREKGMRVAEGRSGTELTQTVRH